MTEKYTRAVGTVQSNGVGGWSVDVELRPVWPTLTSTPYVAPRSAWTPGPWAPMEAEEKAKHEMRPNTKDLERERLGLEVLQKSLDLEYTTANKAAGIRKLEIEVEKLEAEVACKEADLLFSAACTRMKMAEASVLEAKAQLEWELMAQGRDRVEMRILYSNARRGEAMAEQDERNNRHYTEMERRSEAKPPPSDAVQYGEVDLNATPELRTDVPGVVGRAPYQPIA